MRLSHILVLAGALAASAPALAQDNVATSNDVVTTTNAIDANVAAPAADPTLSPAAAAPADAAPVSESRRSLPWGALGLLGLLGLLGVRKVKSDR